MDMESVPTTTGQQTKAGGEQQPGVEHRMEPKPQIIRDDYKGAGKLQGRVAIITGADSGIGRAVAVHFAREGAAAVTICYLNEHKDAEETKAMVEREGAKALCIAGDVGNDGFCKSVVQKTLTHFGVERISACVQVLVAVWVGRDLSFNLSCIFNPHTQTCSSTTPRSNTASPASWTSRRNSWSARSAPTSSPTSS